MSVLFDWLAQPLGLIFSVMALALVLAACRQWLLSRVAMLAGLLLLWVASAPWSANLFARHLEGGSTSSSSCALLARSAPVVVLGGGLNAWLDSDNPLEVLSPETLQRTLKALELDDGHNRFYLLGGGQTARKLSDYMSQVMQMQGIEPARIITERRSLSTIDNAAELAKLLPAATTPSVVLVTSQLHLKRATATFEQHGYAVCSVGAGTLYAPAAGWVGLLPYVESFEKTTRVWREWLALLWYRWKYGIG